MSARGEVTRERGAALNQTCLIVGLLMVDKSQGLYSKWLLNGQDDSVAMCG